MRTSVLEPDWRSGSSTGLNKIKNYAILFYCSNIDIGKLKNKSFRKSFSERRVGLLNKKKLKPYLFIGANKTGAVKTDRCRDFLTLKSSQPGQLDEDLIRLKSSAPIKGAKISMLDTLHNTGGNQNLKITCPR